MKGGWIGVVLLAVLGLICYVLFGVTGGFRYLVGGILVNALQAAELFAHWNATDRSEQ